MLVYSILQHCIWTKIEMARLFLIYQKSRNNHFKIDINGFKWRSWLAHNYELELLSFLALFKRQKLLGFSYEKKDGKWILFLHFPSGIVQISGARARSLRDTVYASLIVETVLWGQDKKT